MSQELFELLTEQILNMESQIKTIKFNLKKLDRLRKKEEKDYQKKIAKLETKKASKTKTTSKTKKKELPIETNFTRKSEMSDELKEFLLTSEKMNMAEVYKAVVQYIKDNNLQNIENRKNINLDEKLETLLAPNDDEEVTFFNLKSLLEKHFIS